MELVNSKASFCDSLFAHGKGEGHLGIPKCLSCAGPSEALNSPCFTDCDVPKDSQDVSTFSRARLAFFDNFKQKTHNEIGQE